VTASAAGSAAWFQAAGALVLLAVVAHCAARMVQAIRAAARPEAVWAAADALMAVGLAGMLSPSGSPVPPVAGEGAFGLVAAWSLVGALRASEAVPRVEWAGHAVGGAAMVYMFAAMSVAAVGLLTWVLVAYFAVFAAWSALATVRGLSVSAGRVATANGPPPTLPAMVLAPPVESLCHTAMAVAMVSLLLPMR
jgi:hypothetical protein